LNKQHLHNITSGLVHAICAHNVRLSMTRDYLCKLFNCGPDRSGIISPLLCVHIDSVRLDVQTCFSSQLSQR